jgi:hypothetical protein
MQGCDVAGRMLWVELPVMTHRGRHGGTGGGGLCRMEQRFRWAIGQCQLRHGVWLGMKGYGGVGKERCSLLWRSCQSRRSLFRCVSCAVVHDEVGMCKRQEWGHRGHALMIETSATISPHSRPLGEPFLSSIRHWKKSSSFSPARYRFNRCVAR